MAMHLLGPEYTTTRTLKPRTKLSQARMRQLKSEWHEHNRWLKHNHMSKISFEEFQDYVCGKTPKPEPDRTRQLKPSDSPHLDRMEAYKNIPSHGIQKTGGECARRESPKYTGELIKGIAQTHKSNAVPVISDEEIIDIRHMRR